MRRIQDSERVWWYIQREAEETLERPLTAEECVIAVVVVAALTKLLADTPEPAPRTIKARAQ